MSATAEYHRKWRAELKERQASLERALEAKNKPYLAGCACCHRPLQKVVYVIRKPRQKNYHRHCFQYMWNHKRAELLNAK